MTFELRPNRLKNRDLWDIAWLHQLQVKPAFDLVAKKLSDHHAQTQAFLNAFSDRAASLKNDPAIVKEFRKEMQRFLPNQIVKETVLNDNFWIFLSTLLDDYRQQLHQVLAGSASATQFKM